MLTAFLIIFCIATIALTIISRHLVRMRKLPPGPIGVPILGYLPFLDVFHLGESFGKLSDRFGDVLSLRVGTSLAVVLDSYESIREAFKREDLCARPDTFMFRFFSRGGQNGIAATSGENWSVARDFTHKTLRTLGFGTPKMERLISDEISDLIRRLEEPAQRGTPIEMGYDINVAVVNTIWALISGERRPHDDVRLQDFLQAVTKSIEAASTSAVLLFMPFLAKVLPERCLAIDQLRKWMAKTFAYIQEVVDEHKMTLDQDSPRDFIDAFLIKMQKDGVHPSFTEDQLLVLCSDLLGSGSEPTSVTLKWALRFLALAPEVQARAQEEIDRVVGMDNMVTCDDRCNLPYVQAMIYDIIRLADIHPVGVLHANKCDVDLNGFVIPKNTFIFPNFHRVHHSPRHWTHPDKLHPEHFLDNEGRLISGEKRDGFLAFSIGPRKCPGQETAYIQLFLFLTNLLQKFEFRLPEDDDGSLEASPGIVSSPKPYSLVLRQR